MDGAFRRAGEIGFHKTQFRRQPGEQETMTKERFWVVGGEYSCLAFTKLKNGAPQVLGPYESRDEAKQAWAKVSEETRSQATMRFAIASEQLVLPA